jgi:16S rRNA (guanine(966)-N(2))-methyltransferase RsmD
MRIIGGERRGRKLVEWEDSSIRPMRDFVRSALYNILSDFVDGAAFLDLYCGTGSVGLEALSRGAQSCTFVDRSADACAIVRRNLDALDFLPRGEVIQGEALDVLDRLRHLGRRFDLVFVGPPYYRELAPRALEGLGDAALLCDDPVVVAEIHSTESIHDAFGRLSLVDHRRYGDNQLWFYRTAADIEGSAGRGDA